MLSPNSAAVVCVPNAFGFDAVENDIPSKCLGSVPLRMVLPMAPPSTVDAKRPPLAMDLVAEALLRKGATRDLLVARAAVAAEVRAPANRVESILVR